MERSSTAKNRLRLISEGWRTLDTSTDPRRGVATEGSEITIGYFPGFEALGVGKAMYKTGRVEDESAVYLEVYRRGKHSWIPN